MKTIKSPKERSLSGSKELRNTVTEIIEEVRLRGDKALLEFSMRFDSSKRDSLKVELCELTEALKLLDGGLKNAMERALRNIRAFALAQRKSLRNIERFSPEPGLVIGQRLLPVESCLCYIPGGNFPLFSTALMLVTPAKVAGVRRVVACSPVMHGQASIHPVTLAALALAGADEVYALGGAQAIAAFAYGTEQIPPCDLIVGPGNEFVAEAKRQCYGQVGIDFIAGPSEVLIIADDRAKADFIAADLLAQCEHDVNAQATLVTTSARLAESVIKKIESELAVLETVKTAGISWAERGGIYLAETLDEAAAFANSRAPEHLELQTCENKRLVSKLYNYGALFDGEYAAEVFGDYVAGTNHTLPTSGAARYTGGLGVGTFLKTVCFQKASPKSASRLAPFAATLANAEGLCAHRNAAEQRLINHKKPLR
ncbi:MAG: histidinol dehydrogenase [Spirochaetaceae bacterium]|jgi:histidinol dehydrogenase|nr:histidinol dehydrogenase [Spirochaetaceae bacterium]